MKHLEKQVTIHKILEYGKKEWVVHAEHLPIFKIYAGSTKKELIKTKWGKSLLTETKGTRTLALEIASDPSLLVYLYKTYETGESMWAISVTNDKYPCFWIDAKKTKKEALALCKEMGWKVVK